MPRTYVRKTSRMEYNQSDLDEAVTRIRRKEITFGQASQRYGIPKTTIYDHAKAMTNTTTVRMGRHTILPKSLEDQLFEYTLTMSDMFFGLTQDKLRSIAYELACRNGIKHPFDHESKKAGKDWLYGFLKRYPSLSLRSPEPTSLSRAIGFRKTEVETFYNNLEKVLSKENIQATDVYNCDEVGMSSVQKPQKVLAKKGKKQVGQIVSAEKGETTTALVCMSAGGNFIPPMLIYSKEKT